MPVATPTETAREREREPVIQFTVFIPNRLGRLFEVTCRLAEREVHILALTVLDTTDSTILRFVVDDPDRASLSFPPINGASAVIAADPPNRGAARNRAPPARAVSAAPRPVPKPREIRETVSPPPAACTSNMAALGFCTLPPAAAKE